MNKIEWITQEEAQEYARQFFAELRTDLDAAPLGPPAPSDPAAVTANLRKMRERDANRSADRMFDFAPGRRAAGGPENVRRRG